MSAEAPAGVEPEQAALPYKEQRMGALSNSQGNGHPLALITACTLMDSSKSERLIMPTGKLLGM